MLSVNAEMDAILDNLGFETVQPTTGCKPNHPFIYTDDHYPSADDEGIDNFTLATGHQLKTELNYLHHEFRMNTDTVSHTSYESEAEYDARGPISIQTISSPCLSPESIDSECTYERITMTKEDDSFLDNLFTTCFDGGVSHCKPSPVSAKIAQPIQLMPLNEKLDNVHSTSVYDHGYRSKIQHERRKKTNRKAAETYRKKQSVKRHDLIKTKQELEHKQFKLDCEKSVLNANIQLLLNQLDLSLESVVNKNK